MSSEKFKFREIYLVVALIAIGIAMSIFGAKETLDTKFFYTADQAGLLLKGLSSAERQRYLWTEELDLLFVTTYSLWFFSLYRRFQIRKTWLALVPGIIDVVETITVMVLLSTSWDPPFWLGYMTCLKWVSGCLVVAAIGIRSIASK